MEEQFLQWHEKYADAIFRHCYYRVFDREIALELTQDAFMRLWDTLCRGQEVKNPRALLYTIATNLVIDERRHAVRAPETSLETLMQTGYEPQDPDQQRMERSAEASLALRLLQDVPQRDREVLLLACVDGLRAKEIAKLTGDTPGAISTRLSRLKKSLNEKAQQLEQNRL